MNISIIFSLLIFVITFWVMFSWIFNRTVVALFWAVMMVMFWVALGFYSPDIVLSSIDFETIVLLWSMMIIVAVLENSWAFQYLAIKTAKKTWWKPWLLLVALWTLTSLLSLILNNVTTIILIAPVTIIVCSIIKINPIPLLLAEIFLSNIWWVATLIWDPPNIIIGSVAWFSFNDFLIHSLPIVFIAWLFSLLFLRFIFRKELKNEPQNIKHLTQMKESKSIKDIKTLRKTLFVLFLVVILFFLHNFFYMKASLVALFWASLLLLMVSPHNNPEKIFEKVELSVLIFFASLFVLVWWLDQSWVLLWISNFITSHAQDNILLTAIIILWSSAFLSSIIGNIPMTVAMIPIISNLQAQGLELSGVLWWALVFWVWFWANITPIWSAAWLLIMSKSEEINYKLSFTDWIKSWWVISVVCLLVSTLAIIAFQDYFAF